MADLNKLFKFGWLLIVIAALMAVLVIVGIFNGLGFWAALWIFVLVVLPLSVVGFAFLGKRWFKISKRTGRRL